MSAFAPTLERNLARVRGRIDAALARAGRPPGSARLIAVTKSVKGEVARALVALGQRDLGESRVDALEEKSRALEADPSAREAGVRWHMIGHLQRNKARRFLESGALLHSLDSPRLALALEKEMERRGAPPGDGPLRVLVEVNVSGEAQKGGVAPAALPPLLEMVRGAGRLEASGLMTLAPLTSDPETTRPVFRALRELRDRHRERHPELVELSMGMSGDFEVALEEGATLVRVGTALFEGLPEEALAEGERAEGPARPAEEEEG
jgi:hypothetical protein